MSSDLRMNHHIRALPPAVRAMQKMGFSAAQCLEGTGISERALLTPDALATFSLQQEFRFHRNLLQLSGDPLLGLALGKAYNLQSYGLFGYAFLSAPTLRQALMVVRNYGPLSLTLFNLDFSVTASSVVLRFSPQVDIPDDLQRYYVDRDLAATLYGAESALPAPMAPTEVTLMHNHTRERHAYESFFNCPVIFNAAYSQLRINALLLDAPMPLRDMESSGVLQQQCELLLARMSASSGFVEQVRQFIVQRPGYFPDIDYIAEKLHMSSRTLRRKLTTENSSYQEILAEVRYQLAREYLSTSNLPLEEISSLLGYSAPGNFTNAFKRWHGSSPRQFRQESS
jgi:AraC-like DNA-binding protein